MILVISSEYVSIDNTLSIFVIKTVVYELQYLLIQRSVTFLKIKPAQNGIVAKN